MGRRLSEKSSEKPEGSSALHRAWFSRPHIPNPLEPVRGHEKTTNNRVAHSFLFSNSLHDDHIRHSLFGSDNDRECRIEPIKHLMKYIDVKIILGDSPTSRSYCNRNTFNVHCFWEISNAQDHMKPEAQHSEGTSVDIDAFGFLSMRVPWDKLASPRRNRRKHVFIFAQSGIPLEPFLKKSEKAAVGFLREIQTETDSDIEKYFSLRLLQFVNGNFSDVDYVNKEKTPLEFYQKCIQKILHCLPTRIDVAPSSISVLHHPELRASLWRVLLFAPSISTSKNRLLKDLESTPQCTYESAAAFFADVTGNPNNYADRIPAVYSALIEKDIYRTFPTHCLFRSRGVGCAMLRSVLRVYACFDPEVGYCQGMNFIAGFLLLQFSPQDAFCCLCALFHDPRWNLRKVFQQGFPLVAQLNKSFEKILRKHLSRAMRRKIDALSLFKDILSAITTQWWMTILVNALPIAYVLRLWDFFLLRGWEGLFASISVILQSQKDRIESLCSAEELTAFLKDGVRKALE